MGASIVARCNSSPVFEPGKQVFHPVPGFVCGLAVFNCFFSVFLWRNTGFNLLLCQHFADFVAVVSAIPDQGLRLGQIPEKNVSALEVAPLAFRQLKSHRSPRVVT